MYEMVASIVVFFVVVFVFMAVYIIAAMFLVDILCKFGNFILDLVRK